MLWPGPTRGLLTAPPSSRPPDHGSAHRIAGPAVGRPAQHGGVPVEFGELGGLMLPARTGAGPRCALARPPRPWCRHPVARTVESPGWPWPNTCSARPRHLRQPVGPRPRPTQHPHRGRRTPPRTRRRRASRSATRPPRNDSGRHGGRPTGIGGTAVTRRRAATATRPARTPHASTRARRRPSAHPPSPRGQMQVTAVADLAAAERRVQVIRIAAGLEGSFALVVSP